MKPRRHANVSCPRDLRMPLNRVLDKVAFLLAAEEGYEGYAPSAEAWDFIITFLDLQIKPEGYTPSPWLRAKEQTATVHEEPV